MRRTNSQSGALMYVFDSQADILNFTDSSRFHAQTRDFVGEDLKSWNEVVERAQKAWAEGMQILAKGTDQLSKAEIPKIKSRKRKSEWTWDEGGEYDAERAKQGLPPFKNTKREDKNAPPEVTLITDTSTPGSYKPEDILWRGALSIALTKLLEDKGYKVELWMVNGSHLFAGKPYPVCTACCLKRPQDPLDLSTLVNVAAGWFYRTAIFTLIRTICDKENERPAWGLGSAYTPRPADLKQITTDDRVIYSSGVFSFQGALAVIKSELTKFKPKDGEKA